MLIALCINVVHLVHLSKKGFYLRRTDTPLSFDHVGVCCEISVHTQMKPIKRLVKKNFSKVSKILFYSFRYLVESGGKKKKD